LAYGLLAGLLWLDIVGVVALFVSIVGWLRPNHGPIAMAEA
jgi:hypothetical protein